MGCRQQVKHVSLRETCVTTWNMCHYVKHVSLRETCVTTWNMCFRWNSFFLNNEQHVADDMNICICMWNVKREILLAVYCICYRYETYFMRLNNRYILNLLCVCVRACVCVTHICIHTYTHIHTHAHARMHTHIHTHTHTHTQCVCLRAYSIRSI